jgi:uncharacterized protein (DUF3084 family)
LRINAGPSGTPLAIIRDAETETLLRTVATPYVPRGRPASETLVRIIVFRDDAITSFASTGNRMLIRMNGAWTSRVLRREHDRC